MAINFELKKRKLKERYPNWTIFAEDLKTLIEQTMVPPIIAMGHSLGAVTSYIAAVKFPQLFSCLILIDPSILPRRILWSIAVMKLLGPKGNIPLARTAWRRRRIFQRIMNSSPCRMPDISCRWKNRKNARKSLQNSFRE